jgi:glycerophosphoryl diester phosphodiesterase
MHDHLAALMARPIAHRGLHDRARGVIENSPAAFEAAASAGFGIECDVQLTADGDAVVFHDYELGRLTGQEGRVDRRRAAELSAIALEGSASGDRIPTLAEMLETVGGRVPIVIEIKSRFDGDLRLTQRVAELASAFPDHPLTIESFDPRVVAALRVMAPDRPRGFVGMARYEYPDYTHIGREEKEAMANLLHFTEMQPDFLSWKVSDLRTAAPFLARAGLGLPVSAWTVRTADDRAFAAAHADQIVFEGFTPE